MIDAARGVIRRRAGRADLWANATVLSATAAAVLSPAAISFTKRAA